MAAITVSITGFLITPGYIYKHYPLVGFYHVISHLREGIWVKLWIFPYLLNNKVFFKGSLSPEKGRYVYVSHRGGVVGGFCLSWPILLSCKLQYGFTFVYLSLCFSNEIIYLLKLFT